MCSILNIGCSNLGEPNEGHMAHEGILKKGGCMEWRVSSERASEVLHLNCRDVERLLGEYVDGELPTYLSHELDGHLSACPACRQMADEYMQVIAIASTLRETEEISIGVKNRLRLALNSQLGISLPYLDS